VSLRNFRVVILAAQRKGATDPLAQRFGVSHKCVAPLHGYPLIGHVLRTVAGYPSVETVMVSIEAEAFDLVRPAFPAASPSAAPIACVAAADNIADSVIAAAEGHDGPILITTADNALLTRASLDAMLKALQRHDAAIGMAGREAVLSAHPDGQRRFYKFRDGEFSNCNLYGLANSKALRAAEIFRGGGQFAKKASRIVEAFGLINLALLRLRLLSLPGGLRRISRRIGLDIAPVVLLDGSQAIDVDNDRTYGVVSELLARRGPPQPMLSGSAGERTGEIAEHHLPLASGY